MYKSTYKLKVYLTSFVLAWTCFYPNGSDAKDKTQIMTQLQKLYPYFDTNELATKVQAAENPFQFFRSFIPYFYYLMASGEYTVGTLNEVSQSHGWCAGDAHIENFGALLDANGKANFTLNDWDDSGPCPLYADFLRLLTGAILNDASLGSRELLESYQDGLSGRKSAPESREVISLLKEGEQEGTALPKKELETPGTLKRDSQSQEIDMQTRQSLTQTLASTYQAQIKLVDIYKTKKTGGGSHGLVRYRALIQRGGGPGIEIIEMKQMVVPGVFPLISEAVPEAAVSFQTSSRLYLSGSVPSAYSFAKMGGMDMLIRPLWKGNKKVSLKDFDLNQLKAVLKDEAMILGKTHSLMSDTQYMKAVASTSAEDWSRAAQALAQEIKESFKIVH